jgi:hypothetical protein
MPIDDTPNADSVLMVKFYKGARKNHFLSAKEGREIFDEVDMVKIFAPGQLTAMNEVDTFVRGDHVKRFPRQWAAYQAGLSNEGALTGTPIEAWPIITTASAQGLKALAFYTVEAVANASDQQLQGIGMVAGMSPIALRDKAKAFLDLAKKTVDHEQEMLEKRAVDERLEALEKQNRELMDMNKALLDQNERAKVKRRIKSSRLTPPKTRMAADSVGETSPPTVA